jgi:hypothetical protein
MHIPKLFCADCGTEMLPRKNGVALEVKCKSGSYFKTSTDAWACHSCGRVIYYGHNQTVAHAPYEPKYEARRVDDTVTVAEVRGHFVGQREDIPVPMERDCSYGGSFLELLYALTKVKDEASEWSGLHDGKDLSQRVIKIASDALAKFNVLTEQEKFNEVMDANEEAIKKNPKLYKSSPYDELGSQL